MHRLKRHLRLVPALLLCGAPLLADPPRPTPPPQEAKASSNAKSTSKAKSSSRGALTKASSDEKLKPFRDAFERLEAATDTKDMVNAMEVIRKGFPDSRPVVAECATKGSVKVRSFAVQVLGEYGDAREDLKPVAAALDDENHKVRLAAIMACRRLGKDSCAALAAHLPREADANNRKMAVKALQHWSYKESMPLLVQTLKAEKEQAVRNFIVRALEALSGQKRGGDVAAWEAYLDDQAASKQAQELAKDPQPPTPGAKKP
jgi:HEAT repeat protein